MSPRKAKLTVRQQRILDFLRDFISLHGFPPTVRDIASALHVSSTSVVDYNLRALERHGFIRRRREISRGIELLSPFPAKAPNNIVAVPIVGRIAAGEPIEAISDEIEKVELTADLVPEGAYALRVKGLSMIEDLIDDGDLVIVRPQSTAENGDIIVALINDGPTGEPQATLKRFYKEKDLIRLQPANSSMQPIYVRPEHLTIQGKVVALLRRLA